MSRFTVMIDGKPQAKGELTRNNLLEAFKSIYQRYYGIPEDVILMDFFDSFKKPVGYDARR